MYRQRLIKTNISIKNWLIEWSWDARGWWCDSIMDVNATLALQLVKNLKSLLDSISSRFLEEGYWFLNILVDFLGGEIKLLNIDSLELYDEGIAVLSYSNLRVGHPNRCLLRLHHKSLRNQIHLWWCSKLYGSLLNLWLHNWLRLTPNTTKIISSDGIEHHYSSLWLRNDWNSAKAHTLNWNRCRHHLHWRTLELLILTGISGMHHLVSVSNLIISMSESAWITVLTSFVHVKKLASNSLKVSSTLHVSSYLLRNYRLKPSPVLIRAN